jgi:hypothetical protein
MHNHWEIGVYKTTGGLCKKKGSMHLPIDMQTHLDHGETVDYIP